jgi:quinolinate synthase
VHEQFTGGEIEAMRDVVDGLFVIAHPECPPEVITAADFTGSTAEMIDYINVQRPAKVLLLTECSMGDNIAAEAPYVEFIKPCGLCPHMKRITLQNIRRSLESMQTEVTIDPDVAVRARLAVERMLAVT